MYCPWVPRKPEAPESAEPVLMWAVCLAMAAYTGVLFWIAGLS